MKNHELTIFFKDFFLGSAFSAAILAILIKIQYYTITIEGTAIRAQVDETICMILCIALLSMLVSTALMIYIDRDKYTGK